MGNTNDSWQTTIRPTSICLQEVTASLGQIDVLTLRCITDNQKNRIDVCLAKKGTLPDYGVTHRRLIWKRVIMTLAHGHLNDHWEELISRQRTRYATSRFLFSLYGKVCARWSSARAHLSGASVHWSSKCTCDRDRSLLKDVLVILHFCVSCKQIIWIRRSKNHYKYLPFL